MSNLKTLTTIAIAALLADLAFAQDSESDLRFDMTTTIIATDFSSADLDQNGSLNADEFVAFAIMRSEGGNETFKDIVIGGEYAASFTAHDTDASGGVEIMELVVHDQIQERPEMMELEEEETLVPDL